MKRLVVALFLLALVATPVLAVNPDEMLKDPVLEQRARDISKGLRCLVCQNESIDDSDADLARDLRILVRERLTAGDTDDQVRAYIVDRYGEFVLLRPVLAWHTLLLWGAAPAVLLIGIGYVLVRARRTRRRQGVSGPTPEEQAALDAIGAEKPD